MPSHGRLQSRNPHAQLLGRYEEAFGVEGGGISLASAAAQLCLRPPAMVHWTHSRTLPILHLQSARPQLTA